MRNRRISSALKYCALVLLGAAPVANAVAVGSTLVFEGCTNKNAPCGTYTSLTTLSAGTALACGVQENTAPSFPVFIRDNTDGTGLLYASTFLNFNTSVATGVISAGTPCVSPTDASARYVATFGALSSFYDAVVPRATGWLGVNGARLYAGLAFSSAAPPPPAPHPPPSPQPTPPRPPSPPPGLYENPIEADNKWYNNQSIIILISIGLILAGWLVVGGFFLITWKNYVLSRESLQKSNAQLARFAMSA